MSGPSVRGIGNVEHRVSALKCRVSVGLERTEAFIRQRLEEMERDNFMRLKRFKVA